MTWVGQQPNLTLAHLRDALQAHGGQRVCLGTGWRVLDEHELRRKKKLSTPPSATRPAS